MFLNIISMVKDRCCENQSPMRKTSLIKSLGIIMCRKQFFLVPFVLLLVLATDVSGVVWDDGGADSLWSTAANWNTDTVPTIGEYIYLDKTDSHCWITSGINAECGGIELARYAVPCYLEITGGTLLINGNLTFNRFNNSVGVMNLYGGVVTITNDLYLGYAGGTGCSTLNMYGGTLNVSNRIYIPRYSSQGTGHINLHGGTINTSEFLMRYTGGVGTMDVAGGTLVIDGDVKEAVQGYVDNGWITAYGMGSPPNMVSDTNYYISIKYNFATDKTTVTAQPVDGIWYKGPFSDDFADDGGILDVYFENERMPLSRYPNTGFMKMNGVIWNGVLYYGSDVVGDGVGKFYYDDMRTENWLTAVDHGLWVRGFWRAPWSDRAVRVDSIDTAADTITHAVPISQGIGSKYPRLQGIYQGSYAEPYWVFNILEEIDQPGEWCVDLLDNKLYFWPPGNIGQNSVVIGSKDIPIVTVNDANNIRFEGIIFEGSKVRAIEVNGGTRNLIYNCEIRNCLNGVSLSGGTNHGVLDCEIHSMGGNGVKAYGGDRYSLTPANHFVVNNHIFDIGESSLGQPVSFPNAVGCRLANNHLHDAPGIGVSWLGNDNIFEYNVIDHVSQVSSDNGCFYSYMRFTNWGNVIRHNFFHNNPCYSVYHDDGASGLLVYGNVTDGNLGMFISGGHDNHFINNIVVNSSAGIFIDSRGIERGYGDPNSWAGEILWGDCYLVNHTSPLWSVAYPGITDILTFYPELPTGNIFDDNLFVGCGTDYSKQLNSSVDPDAIGLVFGDRIHTQEDPGFYDPNNMDYRLDPNSWVYDELPDFKPIPFEMMGQYDEASAIDTMPPAAPTGLTATAGDISVSLDWADNTEPDLMEYDIYRSMTSGSNYASIYSGAVTSDYVDSDVINGTMYYYVVTAIDASSNESGFSNEVSATPSAWTQIIYDDFESGLGNWNIPGTESFLYTEGTYAYEGNNAVNLQDDRASYSIMTTGDLTLSGYSEVKVDFAYICISMDSSDEDFWLQISTDGGSNFTTVEEWNLNDEFVNDQFYTDSVTINGYTLTDQTQIRFRCDASGNKDDVYIDTVTISGQ